VFKAINSLAIDSLEQLAAAIGGLLCLFCEGCELRQVHAQQFGLFRIVHASNPLLGYRDLHRIARERPNSSRVNSK
jgi:hypothetical protein